EDPDRRLVPADRPGHRVVTVGAERALVLAHLALDLDPVVGVPESLIGAAEDVMGVVGPPLAGRVRAHRPDRVFRAEYAPDLRAVVGREGQNATSSFSGAPLSSRWVLPSHSELPSPS